MSHEYAHLLEFHGRRLPTIFVRAIHHPSSNFPFSFWNRHFDQGNTNLMLLLFSLGKCSEARISRCSCGDSLKSPWFWKHGWTLVGRLADCIHKVWWTAGNTQATGFYFNYKTILSAPFKLFNLVVPQGRPLVRCFGWSDGDWSWSVFAHLYNCPVWSLNAPIISLWQGTLNRDPIYMYVSPQVNTIDSIDINIDTVKMLEVRFCTPTHLGVLMF